MTEPRPRVPCNCPACSGIEPPKSPTAPQYRSYANTQIVGAVLLGIAAASVGAWYVTRVLEDVSKW